MYILYYIGRLGIWVFTIYSLEVTVHN